MARFPDGLVFIYKVSDTKANDGKCYADASVESRELVLCKNCKYYEEEPYGDVMMCYRGMGWPDQNDYCSNGERRDDSEADRCGRAE